MPAVGLSPRQEKWFASVQASLAKNTGKTLEQWVEIAKTWPGVDRGWITLEVRPVIEMG